MGALLAVQAIVAAAYGSWCAWALQADIDMAARAAEYGLFRQGIYPNSWLERPPSGVAAVYTVYPPYVFPLFAFFFEPGGLPQGRFLIESLSIVALVVMGLFAFRTLIPHGRSIAWVGAVSGAAIASNGSVFYLGQFSILCVGLLVQQIIFLERGRSLAAGACWALAMIKPQIALPFLVLFPMLRQASGGLFGIAMLATLAGAACAWTGVSPAAMVDHWGRGMSLGFISYGGGIGPGSLVRNLGIGHRTAQLATAAMMAAMFVMAIACLRRINRSAVLPVAALCSVCGMFCFYHRYYDNIMLFPLLLTALRSAAASHGRLATATAVAMLISLAIPKRILTEFTFHENIQAAVWMAAAVPAAWSVWTSSRTTDAPNAVDTPLDRDAGAIRHR